MNKIAKLDIMFPFEIRVNNLRESQLKLRGNKLSGAIRHSNLKAIAVGGDSPGSLNLGFRAKKQNSSEILFEGRVEFNNNLLSPGVWHNFNLSFMNAEAVIGQGIFLTIDFVVEGVFWFQEHQAGFVTMLVHYPSNLSKDDFGSTFQERRSNNLDAAGRLTDRSSQDSNKLNNGLFSLEMENDKSSTVVFDISDLMQFWSDNIRPTGIQRVQSEVVKEAIDQNPEKILCEVSVVFFHLARLTWMKPCKRKLTSLIEFTGRSHIDLAEWNALLSDIIKSSIEYSPRNEDIIVNLGSSWWIPDYLRRIEILKRKFQIRYVPFIHDAIPLATPQYCDENLVGEFRTWFREACNLADHVIVNSNASAKDVSFYSEKLTGKLPSISVATLNAAFPRRYYRSQTGILEKLNLDDRPYVLCIGTLEIRKNHAMLFRVWERLASSIPEAQMATLVVVGKEGWMFDSAKIYLNRSSRVRRWVKTLHGLSDAELSELYDGCIFNVYPSFYEGWGLPVTEASSYGKLNVASNSSSIPEAASKGDILVDPLDEEKWFKVIKSLLTDYEKLLRANSISQKGVDLRSWNDIANDIISAALNSVFNHSAFVPAKIKDGVIYDFSLTTLRQNYDCSAGQYRCGVGWHHLEEWGAWSAPGATELRFAVEDDSDRIIYLVLRAGPIQTGFNLSVNRQELLTRTLRQDEQVVLRIGIPYNSDNMVHLRINVSTYCDLSLVTNGQDGRQIGIGLLKLSVMKANDVVGRINFIESLGMHIV